MATNKITNIVAENIGGTTSIFHTVLDADIVVKSVILLLMLASVWSWAIIIDKYIKLKAINIKTRNFEKSFWSGQLLEQIYERIKRKPDHPMAKIFVAAMDEWSENMGKKSNLKNDTFSRMGQKERIFQAMNLAKFREMDKLEKRLVFLATVGSSATFVGLFGTVWGIMHSFQSIAATKNTTLAVVAPGIAEALFATLVGLFVAVPAMVFYNFLARQVNNFEYKLEGFSTELGGILTREIEMSEK